MFLHVFNHCLFDLSAFFYIHVYSCLFVCFIKFRKNRGSKYEVQQGMVPFWGIWSTISPEVLSIYFEVLSIYLEPLKKKSKKNRKKIEVLSSWPRL